MASFQAKIGWKMMRQRENKNYRYVLSLPTGNIKFQKNSKKIQKIKKYIYGFFSSPNRFENHETERKSKLSFRFVLTGHVIENSKKIKKIAKKLKKFKNAIMASFQSKIRLRRPKKRENENYCSDPFLLDP